MIEVMAIRPVQTGLFTFHQVCLFLCIFLCFRLQCHLPSLKLSPVFDGLGVIVLRRMICWCTEGTKKQVHWKIIAQTEVLYTRGGTPPGEVCAHARTDRVLFLLPCILQYNTVKITGYLECIHHLPCLSCRGSAVYPPIPCVYSPLWSG